MQVTKFNLVTDLQIMLFNVTHSNFYFECNTERGSIDQLYIELGISPFFLLHRRTPLFWNLYHLQFSVKTNPFKIRQANGPSFYQTILRSYKGKKRRCPRLYMYSPPRNLFGKHLTATKVSFFAK